MKLTRKILFFIFSLMIMSNLYAHSVLENASNLTRGEVPDIRIDQDNSTITKRGQLSDGLETLKIGSMTVIGNINVGSGTVSANQFKGDGSLLINIAGSQIQAGATSYVWISTGGEQGGTLWVTSITAGGGVSLFQSSSTLDYLHNRHISVSSITGQGQRLSLSDIVRIRTSDGNVFSSTQLVRLVTLDTTISTQGQKITELIFSTINLLLVGGNTNYILNQSTLQSGTTFFTSSGTASYFNASTGNFTTVHFDSVTMRNGLAIALNDIGIFRWHDGTIMYSTMTRDVNRLSDIARIQVAKATTDINNLFSSTATTNSIFDNGTFITQNEGSNLSTTKVLNFVGAQVNCTNSGSTVTCTITGDGSGDVDRTEWDAIACTGTKGGCTDYPSSVQGYELLIASFGLRGLSQSTTAQAQILFDGSPFDISIATIPAGLYIQGTTTTSWRHTGAVNSMFVQTYGTVKGITFDENNRNFSVPQVIWKSGIFEGNKVINSDQTNGGDGGANSAFLIEGFNGRVLYNNFPQLRKTSGVGYYGSDCGLFVRNSSDVLIEGNYVNYTGFDDAGCGFGVQGTTNVVVENNTFNSVSVRFMMFQGGNSNFKFERNTVIDSSRTVTDGDAIIHTNDTGFSASISSNCSFSKNKFYLKNNGTNKFVIGKVSTGTAGFGTSGLIIDDNEFYCMSDTYTLVSSTDTKPFAAYTPIMTLESDIRPLVTNNRAYGCKSVYVDKSKSGYDNRNLLDLVD